MKGLVPSQRFYADAEKDDTWTVYDGFKVMLIGLPKWKARSVVAILNDNK